MFLVCSNMTLLHTHRNNCIKAPQSTVVLPICPAVLVTDASPNFIPRRQSEQGTHVCIAVRALLLGNCFSLLTLFCTLRTYLLQQDFGCRNHATDLRSKITELMDNAVAFNLLQSPHAFSHTQFDVPAISFSVDWRSNPCQYMTTTVDETLHRNVSGARFL